ncbi:methionyl-tRNA formyltransferase [Aquirufa nivalisilvae]|jgi:methionyl-tRNA formyltransferase|uniref:methionyl-tRNA formyltransferase n=1 Tax=Aquirufa nivalisilvae TaxID=2516557 RepID=UPI0022A93A5D|nr:methionyl-tRNA formyltransferase [Aquirufa nivalisilvae]MCZ2481744.1 methionyl-tRNA formyltransferase [Aquirufa nivalisilvae]
MRLGLLVSGGLGAEILIKIGEIHDIVFVFTDRLSSEIQDYANLHSIPIFVGNPRNESTSTFIKDKSIDVLVSVNYLYIIDNQLIGHPSKFAINIHGSLLPKYRGRTPHVWAIINNESETGITAHVIDEGCDTGPILEQIQVRIESEDTGNLILEKYKKLYFPILKDVLTKIESGSYQLTQQDDSLATYFGKRTPEDGQINWNWQRERIRNWVRAQAFPYPGAFCYLNGKKLIIDELVFVERGFHFDQPNGQIVSVNPILVKTPNGVVQLKQVRPFDQTIHIGDILN